MSFDYRKLLGKIVEKYGTQIKFAEAMGFSERTLSLKLNGKVHFKQTEIVKACHLLDIAVSDIADYFFNFEVQ